MVAGGNAVGIVCGTLVSAGLEWWIVGAAGCGGDTFLIQDVLFNAGGVI